MEKFQDILTIIGPPGLIPIVGANVTVWTFGSSTNASIYSSNSTTAPTSNPLTTDSNGAYSFYAANGRYSRQMSGTGIQTTVLTDIILYDPSDAFQVSTGANNIGFVQPASSATVRTVQQKLQETISVLDFGATGDGLTDDTAAIQRAINAVDPANTRCQTLYFPKGRYKVTTTLTFPNSSAFFIWKGDGKTSTNLLWGGVAGIPFLSLTNTREVLLCDFSLTGDIVNPPSYAIQCNIAAGQVYSGGTGKNMFERLNIGTGVGAGVEFTKGIGFTCDAGHDTNNDSNKISEVDFNDCGTGVTFEHFNNLENNLYSCTFASCGTAVSNIGSANSSISNVGGSFAAFGCISGACTLVFKLIGTSHNISVHGWHSEADIQLLDMPFSVSDNANAGGGTSYITANYDFHGLDLYSISSAANPFIKFDAGKGSTLDFIGCKVVSWVSVAGVDLSFPTSGSAVRMIGGQWKIKTMSYNNTVFMDQVTDLTGASAPYTNLGAGRLITGFNDFPNNTLLTQVYPLTLRTLEFWTDNLPQSSGTVTLSDGFGGRGYLMPRPGFIRSMATKCNTTITSGTATFQLRINGSINSNFDSQINTTNPSFLNTNQNVFSSTNGFTSGDMITVSVASNASLLPNNTADFDVAVEVAY